MNISRESIFSTAIRTFLSVLFGALGLLIAFGLIIFASSFMKSPVVEDKITVSVEPDANWDRKLLPPSAPVLLRLDINNVIGLKKMKEKNVMDQLVAAQSRYADSKRLKGILLVIDSPGGAASDSSLIYQHITSFKEKYKIPVYAYVNGMCASGGMYIAASADKVLSAENGVIGSVGVRIGPVLGFSGLMKDYNVEAVTITQGRNKDMLNPTKPFDPNTYKCLIELVKDDYEKFVDIVTKARPRLSKSKLINEYGAEIFSAQRALEYGYVDSDNSSYSDALTELAAAAGIDKDTPYQVLRLQTQNPLFKDLFDEDSMFRKGTIVHTHRFPNQLDPELEGKLLYLYDPKHNE